MQPSVLDAEPLTSNLVDLAPDHPGFGDPIYRARRDAIATLALDWHARARAGEPGPIPIAEYTEAEHEVWRTVWARLEPLHHERVVEDLLALQLEFPIDHQRIPQLAEVSRRLVERTGFRMVPVDGLVIPRRFFGSLHERVFLATQYVRHPSRPLYTPEPDVIHELVGHAATFAHPRLAEINRRFGAVALAAGRAGERGREALARIERVYWFTLEFGLCEQRGELRAWGAGLLSSVGELERATDPRTPNLERRPWDLESMAATDYDTSRYQDVLFVAPSFSALLDDLERWLAHEHAALMVT